MSDAMLTAGAPARDGAVPTDTVPTDTVPSGTVPSGTVPTGAGDRSGGPERADRADSSHVLLRNPAALGRRPDRWLARFRAMTQAPARPAAEVGGRAGPATSDPAMDGVPGARWRRFGWMFAAIWLVYLSQPASTVWADHDLVRRYLGLATLIAFAAVFIATFALSRRRADRQVPLAFGVGALSAEAALIAVGYLSIGADASLLLIYLSVMAVFLLPIRIGWAVVAVAIGASLAVPAMVAGWQPDGTLAFQIFVSALASFGVVQLIQRNMQLAAARNELTRLALADERNRFARDLHDILGHSLTVVAVKAELAGRLTGLDPARAEAEIGDVERIARQALADVRAAAAGYHEVTLDRELASARTALAAAGIEADLPDHEIVGIPRRRQELFSWAVREGVTNVIRHSGATRCAIRVTLDQVEISDDGIGCVDPGGRPPDPPIAAARRAAASRHGWGATPGPADRRCAPSGGEPPRSGHGLAGLRERAAAEGAVVGVGRSALDGFVLRVRMP